MPDTGRTDQELIEETELIEGTRKPDDVTDLLDGPPERRSKTAVKRGKSCLAVLVALGIILAGGLFAWQKFSVFAEETLSTPDYTDARGTKDVRFTVPSGASLTSIGIDLQKADVIKSTKAFKKAIEKYNGNPVVQAGTYKMRTQVPAASALNRLTHPAKYRIRKTVQVLEGLRLSDQVASLSKQTKISRKDFQAALKKPQNLGLPDWAHNRPEGFLFPDTYELTGDTSATSVLKQMTERFGTVSDGLDLQGRAQAMHRSPYDIVIVASIIEKEVRRPADRPKAARVIYNRLAHKMPLQMDSTVHYALNKSDRVTTTPADRANASPYNTYKHVGLPPGPISAPGKASLQAAANPASGSWMYFVTVNPDTGETKFATTLAQHDAYVAEFQAWCGKHPGRC
ncbi:endolytic transglycosylase MltG [Microlunatus sp. Gsoil 973]|uniref:endolytic transglycosylase MltG n=1 Tax=Microlunatus sp. Gsoil 973 TaxID=2672569 RepID=UPI0012B4976C|nr:endolytic transglycosylase MltG [Microlunatus sp. Gsoil 973]QGN32735.1 endolytic transglycosylase MltG [Microlunatus sp. Gsoil 973]